MSLSSYQKLRLQQLEVPLWELRSELGEIVEEPVSNVAKHLEPIKVIASAGNEPVVFFWSDVSTNISEIFIHDFLIGINQQCSAWQHLKGDKTLFEDLLNTLKTRHVAVFISNQFQSVDANSATTSSNQLGIELYLPDSPKDLVQFKKQLWGAVYQNCYH